MQVSNYEWPLGSTLLLLRLRLRNLLQGCYQPKHLPLRAGTCPCLARLLLLLLGKRRRGWQPQWGGLGSPHSSARHPHWVDAQKLGRRRRQPMGRGSWHGKR
ncbi:MAG: hypothetical protein AAF471_08670 [Myxococcota bacterium]